MGAGGFLGVVALVQGGRLIRLGDLEVGISYERIGKMRLCITTTTIFGASCMGRVEETDMEL